MFKFRSRVDRNHRELVTALRAVGAEVLDLSRVGQGCPDLLVGWRGQLTLLEVKSGNGKLSEDQVWFHQFWSGYVKVIRTVPEALAAIGAEVEGGTG